MGQKKRKTAQNIFKCQNNIFGKTLRLNSDALNRN